MSGSGKLIIKVSLILLVVCLIVFVIGFASPYWATSEFEKFPQPWDNNYFKGKWYSGLWTYCEEYEKWSNVQRRGRRQAVDRCLPIVNNLYISGELRATQFFETMGLIGIVGTITLVLVSLCIESQKARKILPIIGAVLCMASAGSILLGTIIFGSDVAEGVSLSWAFYLCVISGVMYLVLGVLVIVGGVLYK